MSEDANERAACAPAVAAVIRFFENISPADIARMGEIYTEDAYFKDPFNEVKGVAAIARIFEHMFAQLGEPRFHVHDALGTDREAFLTWDFLFRRGDQAMRIRGATHLRLDAHGRIHFHRDYWDAAEELYAKLPLLGALMRWLQRRLSS